MPTPRHRLVATLLASLLLAAKGYFKDAKLDVTVDAVINSPDARAEDFGQITAPRLALMASQIYDAYATKTRVQPDAVWNGSFLPSKAALNGLPVKKCGRRFARPSSQRRPGSMLLAIVMCRA